MTEDQLFELMREINPETKRVPPGLLAIAEVIEQRIRAQRAAPAPSDLTDKLIDAAEHYAAPYDDDERDCVKADVMNAFYQGVHWATKHAAPAPSDASIALLLEVRDHFLFTDDDGHVGVSDAIDGKLFDRICAAINAAPAPSEPKMAIVLALARCGLAHEPPSNSFVHQLRRLVESLPPAEAQHFKALLDWHDSGREKSAVRVVLAETAPSDDKDKLIAKLKETNFDLLRRIADLPAPSERQP